MTSTDVPLAPGHRPIAGHALELWRRPIQFLTSLPHAGDIVRVRIGRWTVFVLTNPRHVHQVLVTDSRAYGRGRVFDRLRPLFGNGLVISDGEFHGRQRRLMQPLFHSERVNRLVDDMRKIAESLVAPWSRGQAVAVDELTRDMALRIMANAVFSGEPAQPAMDEVHRSLPIIMRGMLVRAVTPKALERLPIPMNRRFDGAAARLRRVIDDVVAAYRTRPSAGDLLSVLLTTTDAETGDGMSDEQIRDELISTIFAGTETTASTMAWLFHELGQHPDIDERVYTEVVDIVGHRRVEPADLPRLTYTRAVLDETLRVHAPMLFTRRTLAPVTFDGAVVPEGSEVAYSPYVLHRDADVFPHPDVFDPLRWLSPGTKERRHAYMPFGQGPHKCIGASFATIEILTIVATVVRNWRLEPAPDHVVREVPAGMPHPDTLPMVPMPRGSLGIAE